MKIIIVGCGRMGSGLATQLSNEGEDVTIIDTNPTAFNALGEGFKGRKLVGVGFDQAILGDAKISQVDGLVACTDSDDTNALIGRLAQNVFRVPKVIARLYDAHKAELYKSLGIQTISTTSYGINKGISILHYSEMDTLVSIGDGKVDIIRVDAPELLSGRKVNELAIVGQSNVVAIKRGSNTMIPTLGTVIESGDILYISVLADAVDQLRAQLGLM